MELLGTSEIAALAEVGRSTVSNWVARDPSFPKPVADLACGQIWLKADIANWLSSNKVLKEKTMDPTSSLEIGKVYTHDFICKAFGGDAKSGTFLPQSKQTIICGCFTTDMNPGAPERILVGNGPRILAKAERIASQGGQLPVFLKLGTNQWEYKGIFEFKSLSRNISDFAREAAIVDRNDVAALLTFEQVL